MIGCTCGGPTRLAVSGPPAYVRCLADAPPPEGEREVGGLHLRITGRRLVIDGLRAPYRLAAFSGPFAGGRDALVAAEPDLAVVVGGLGDDAAAAAEALAALAPPGVPVLFVAGGEDRQPVRAATFRGLRDRTPLAVDATTLRSVVAGPLELRIVAGAPDGRYAIADDACGVGPQDLRPADPPPSADAAHRLLVSWAAPRAQGLLGAPAGWPALAAYADALGVDHHLFAWPRLVHGSGPAPADEPSEVSTVLRPLVGAGVERADGRWAPPGVTVLRVDRGGVVEVDRP